MEINSALPKRVEDKFVADAENGTSIPEARKPDAAQEISLLDLLVVLTRWKRFILLFTLGTTTVGAIAAFLLPNQYTADSALLPPTANSSSSSAIMSQVAIGALASLPGASLGIKSQGDMYVALFRSRTVEDSVIRRFDLAARYKAKRMTDARKRLESHVAITYGAKDGLIRISARDRDPHMAANLANGYVEEFTNLSDNLAITRQRSGGSSSRNNWKERKTTSPMPKLP